MNNNRKSILFLGDAIALVLSFLVIWLREGKFHFTRAVFVENIWAFLFVAIVTILVLYAFDLYDFRYLRPASSNLWRLGAVIIIAPIVGIIFFYALPIFHVTPKTNLLIFFVSFGILFIIWRRIFFTIFSTSFKNKTVVWGTSAIAGHLFEEIKNNPHRGYDPLIHVRDEENLIAVLDNHNFHVLVIEDTLRLPDHLIEIIFKKQITTLSLMATYEDILQKIPASSIDETVFIQNVQHSKFLSKFFYRVFEYFVAVIILAVFSPFLIIIAIAIIIEDGGSIFYKQSRMGFLGEEFMLYKFRSMTEEHKRKTTGTDWTTKNDARVTRVGKIIRKLHLDEVPQMINVLRGDIALVGPRPDVFRVESDLKQSIPHYHLRHIVKPGFTGWAQIKYHAANDAESFADRFQYDLYYIKNRDFFFDLGILVRTVQIIVSHKL